eukprot:998219-Prymnesium_polylepis.1
MAAVTKHHYFVRSTKKPRRLSRVNVECALRRRLGGVPGHRVARSREPHRGRGGAAARGAREPHHFDRGCRARRARARRGAGERGADRAGRARRAPCAPRGRHRRQARGRRAALRPPRAGALAAAQAGDGAARCQDARERGHADAAGGGGPARPGWRRRAGIGGAGRRRLAGRAAAARAARVYPRP